MKTSIHTFTHGNISVKSRFRASTESLSHKKETKLKTIPVTRKMKYCIDYWNSFPCLQKVNTPRRKETKVFANTKTNLKRFLSGSLYNPEKNHVVYLPSKFTIPEKLLNKQSYKEFKSYVDILVLQLTDSGYKNINFKKKPTMLRFLVGTHTPRTNYPALLLSCCLKLPQLIQTLHMEETEIAWGKTWINEFNPEYTFSSYDVVCLDKFLFRAKKYYIQNKSAKFLKEKRIYRGMIDSYVGIVVRDYIKQNKSITPSLLAQDFTHENMLKVISKLGYDVKI